MGWLSDLWDDVTDFFSDAVDFVVDIFMAPIEWVVDLFTPDIPDYSADIEAAANKNKGTTVNRRGGDNPIPVVYSGYNQYVKLGSVQSYISTSGTDNKFLHLTYVLCHSVDIDKIILGTNETQMRFGNNWKKSNSTDFVRVFDISSGTATYDMTVKNQDNKSVNIIKFHVQRHTGTNITQPSWHNDTAQYPGLITVKVRLQYDNTPYSGTSDPVMGKVPNIIYYVASSENKTEVDFLQDYLTNSTYGAGFDSALFDATSFTTVKGLLNNIIGTRTTPNPIGTSKSYYRLTTDRPVISNIQEMLNHIGCSLLFENGKFFLKADTNMIAYYGKDQTYLDGLTEFNITEHDIIGGVSFENNPSSSKAYTYKNSYNQTGNQEFVWPKDTPAEIKKLRDKGFKVVVPNDENVVTLYSNGHRIMKWRWAEDQIRSNIAFTVTAKHANIKPYDLIKVTYPQINFNDEYYVVTKADLLPNMTVKVQAKRYIKDTTLGIGSTTKIGERDFYDLLVDQGYPYTRRPIVISEPGWAGTATGDGTRPTDGNTQVDEFIPGVDQPEISNLTVEIVNADATSNLGQYIPTVRVTFDEIKEPNVNNYKIFFRRISKGPSYNTLITDTELNDISFQAEYMHPGRSYVIQVVPYSNGIRGEAVQDTVAIPNVDYNRDEIIEFKQEWSYDTHPWGYVCDFHGNADGTLNEDRGGATWDDYTTANTTFYQWTHHTNNAWGASAGHLYDGTELAYKETWATGNQNENIEFDDEIPMAPGDYAVITGYAEVVQHYFSTSIWSDDAGQFSDTIWEGDYEVDAHDVYNAPYHIFAKLYDSSDTLLDTQGSLTSSHLNTAQDALIVDCRSEPTVSYIKLGISIGDKNYGTADQWGKEWRSIHEVNFQIHKNIQVQNSYPGVSTGTIGTPSNGFAPQNQLVNIPTYDDGTNYDTRQPINEVLFATATPTASETKFFQGTYANASTGTYPEQQWHIKFKEISTGNYIDNLTADTTIVGIPEVIQQKNTQPAGGGAIIKKYVIVK